MEDKLYFNPGDFPFIQTELLFRCIAQQKVLIHMNLNPGKLFTEQEVIALANKFRADILSEIYTDYGHTPQS